ncbi:MAG: SPFH domain-containing protein, partial [Candidatus Nitrosopolaris sp.]
MRNPFKRSGSHNASQYSGSGPSSNKLVIVAGVITFVVIIVVMFESVVVIQAGHRGVVLYVGAVENRVLGEGIHFIIPFAEQVVPLEVRTLKYVANAT